MVIPWNFKKFDKTSSVPFSEMLFQCYKAECDEEKELKSYQFAGINTIVEETYEKVSLEVYKRAGRGTPMPKWEKWTSADNENDFLALIGTPKLACFLRMLNDHSVAFGKRLPTELWTNRRAGVHTSSSMSSRDDSFVIEYIQCPSWGGVTRGWR